MSATGKFQQPISGFSPLSLGGCALWLDATSTSNFALTGSNVTAWYDKAPISNHATSVNGGNPVLSNAAINGLPAVYFSNAPSIGGNLTLSNSGVTGFMVIRPLQTGIGRGDQRIFSAATSGTGDWNDNGRFLIGPQGNTTEIRFNRGNTYIPRTNFNASNNYVVSWTYDGLSNYMYLNGADGDLAQGVALSNSAFNTTLYRLANQVAITSETYNGFIGEVIIYDDYLPHSQRRAVEGYLAWKWGIAPSLGTTFSPLTSLSNCAVWFDGADATTLTLSGSNITQWRDKAGSNVTSNIGTPVYVSNAINGVPGVDMNVGAGFYVTPMSNAANTNTISVYGVLTPSNSSQNNARIFTVGRISDGTTNNDFTSSHLWTLFRVQTPGLYMQHNNNSIYFNGGLPAGIPVLISLIFDGGTATLRTDGYSRGTLSTSSTLNFDRIGIFKNINPNAGASYDSFAGQLGEFLIFYAAHTEAQRLQVESYLASKWNIPMRAPPHLVPTHSYTIRKPFLREFLPTDIAGCALWLDAGDSATLTLSASNTVTGWTDKSGNQRSVAMTSGNGTYSSNGFQSLYPTVTFSNTQFMTATLSAALSNAFTVFVVHQITGTGFNFAFSAGAANSIFYTVFRDDFNTYQIGQDNAGSTGNWYYTTQSNRPLVESMVVKPTTPYWNQYLNGVRLVNPNIGGAGTAPLSNVGSCNVMIPGADTFRGGPTTSRYQGQICEVLVFSNAFTTSQRQQMERYLAKKWGLAMTMYGSQAHPYRYGPAVGPTLPTGIPTGASLWLDASDSSTLTLTGSNVTQWRDKSGNGYNATGFGSTVRQAFNSNLGIALSGSEYFTFSSATALNTTNTLSAFVVASAGSPGPDNYGRLLSFGDVGDDSGSIANAVAFERGAGNVIAFERAGLASGSTYTAPFSFVGSMIFNGTTGIQYINGSSNASRASTGSFNYFMYSIGRKSQGGYVWRGTVCEVLAYNFELTTSQRWQVEGYLATKWGLTDSLAPGHPYKTVIQATPIPQTISGCALWLDAQDASAYTLSGSNVTAVIDKSPNAWSLGTASGFTLNSTKFNTTYPSFFGTGGQLGSNGSFTLAQPLTVYFVGQATTANLSTFLFDGASGNRVVIYNGAQLFAGSEFAATNASAASNSHVMSATFNGASSSVTLNGITTTGNVGSGSFGGIRISSRNTGSDGYPGHICELLIYSGTHTTAQREAMEGYLAWKWGIPFRLPGGSNNIASLTRSLTTEFDPRSIGGCATWFDAADAQTIGFSSGSNVNRWLDKSGNGYHATAIASNNTAVYTLNGLGGYPVMTFSRSTPSIFTCPHGPVTSNQPQTIFLVARPSDATNGPSLLSVGLNSQTSLTVDIPTWNSNNWIMGGRWGGMDGTTTTLQASSSRTDIVVGTWRSGVSYMAVNGTEYAISTQTPTSLTSKASGGRTILGTYYHAGGYGPGTYSGYFAEILIFSNFLTNADRQRIEGYLASKWGLQSQLPSLHPYSNVKF